MAHSAIIIIKISTLIILQIINNNNYYGSLLLQITITFINTKSVHFLYLKSFKYSGKLFIHSNV